MAFKRVRKGKNLIPSIEIKPPSEGSIQVSPAGIFVFKKGKWVAAPVLEKHE